MNHYEFTQRPNPPLPWWHALLAFIILVPLIVFAVIPLVALSFALELLFFRSDHR